jgi:hypothetical protein
MPRLLTTYSNCFLLLLLSIKYVFETVSFETSRATHLSLVLEQLRSAILAPCLISGGRPPPLHQPRNGLSHPSLWLTLSQRSPGVEYLILVLKFFNGEATLRPSIDRTLAARTFAKK